MCVIGMPSYNLSNFSLVENNGYQSVVSDTGRIVLLKKAKK